MNFAVVTSNFRQTRKILFPIIHNLTQSCLYAAPGGLLSGKVKSGKKSASSAREKIELPVETDAKKLVSFVCGSNILKEGEDVKLKPDSEYPEWLWKINIGPPRKLEDLDPNTKAYWRKLRKQTHRRNNLKSQFKP